MNPIAILRAKFAIKTFVKDLVVNNSRIYSETKSENDAPLSVNHAGISRYSRNASRQGCLFVGTAA